MAYLGSSELVKYSANISSNKSKTITSPFETFNMPKYAESLNSYKSACQEDPDLKSFDSSLHERTSKLFSSIEGKTGKNSSLDSLNEVCKFQVDLCQDVFKIIIENKEEFSNNKDIKSLVDFYFEYTSKTLNLFNTVEKCVEKADIIQLLIRVAIKEFESEPMERKYAQTLEKLNKVKAMKDPFGEEFETQYESIYKEQVMLLDKIREMQVKLEKKLKNVKKLKKLVNIIFMTTLVALVALSICLTVVALPVVAPLVVQAGVQVAALVGVGALVGALAAEFAVPVTALVVKAIIPPIHTGGTWVNGMLKDYEKSVEAHKDLFLLMGNSTEVNTRAMKTMKSLVETLITRMSSILKTVEVAVEMREEETVKLVMQELTEKVEVFNKKIKQVGAHVSECSESVLSGRNNVLKHINSSASSKGK